MPDLTVSTIASDVVADICATLRDATVAGDAAFAGVFVHDDLESFRRVADPLAGQMAGIIIRPPDRAPSDDNGARWVERLAFEVAVIGASKRVAGSGEDEGLRRAFSGLETAVAALLADRTRGGLCELVTFRGQLITGTLVNGDARNVPPGPNQSFYTAVLPLVCGWRVP